MEGLCRDRMVEIGVEHAMAEQFPVPPVCRVKGCAYTVHPRSADHVPFLCWQEDDLIRLLLCAEPLRIVGAQGGDAGGDLLRKLPLFPRDPIDRRTAGLLCGKVLRKVPHGKSVVVEVVGVRPGHILKLFKGQDGRPTLPRLERDTQ